MARSAAGLTLGLLVCVVNVAAAQGHRLVQAREAYEAGDNERVVQILEPLVGGIVPALDDPYLVRDARRYLAGAYVQLERRSEAESQFRYLLSPLPLAELRLQELDPSRFVEEVLAVFHRVRDQLLREREQAAEASATAAAEREARRHAALLHLVDLAQDVEVELDNDPLPSWLPFGVGQFTNGDDALGWFFLIAEGLTFAASGVVLSTWITLDYQNQQARAGVEGTRPVDEGALTGLIVSQYLSWGAFVALAAVGVIEARVSFRPRRTRRIRREIPDQVLEELDLAVGPGGGSVRGRFW